MNLNSSGKGDSQRPESESQMRFADCANEFLYSFTELLPIRFHLSRNRLDRHPRRSTPRHPNNSDADKRGKFCNCILAQHPLSDKT